MQESEKDREHDERVILEMEKDVAERRRVNASNQDNLKETEDELQQVEKQIETGRVKLFERVK